MDFFQDAACQLPCLPANAPAYFCLPGRFFQPFQPPFRRNPAGLPWNHTAGRTSHADTRLTSVATAKPRVRREGGGKEWFGWVPAGARGLHSETRSSNVTRGSPSDLLFGSQPNQEGECQVVRVRITYYDRKFRVVDPVPPVYVLFSCSAKVDGDWLASMSYQPESWEQFIVHKKVSPIDMPWP